MQPPERLVSAAADRAEHADRAERADRVECATRPRSAPLDLEALLRREGPRLLAYFARRVDPVDDAADLLSETMIVAWRRHDAIPLDETEARMWLFGVARRILSNHRRGATRYAALGERLREAMVLESRIPRSDPDDDRLDALHAALAELKPQDRELVALVHADGFTLAEAGALLDLGPGATRSRYHRARGRLRALIEARLG